MRYFVTLNGRESSLALDISPTRTQRVATMGANPGTPVHDLSAEVLRPRQHGRAALVCVEGRVFRVSFEAAHSGSPRPGSPNSGTAQAGAGLAGTSSSDPLRRPAQRVRINGVGCQLELETELERRARPAPNPSRVRGTRITSPMPGRIVKVNVRPGDVVLAGAALLSVEAMKMENELQAPRAGRVTSVLVQAGATVDADQELIVITPEP